jgi:protoporphyrinogen oxidase
MSVVVVGGGLMGLSAAFHARRTDPTVPVTVLERARLGALPRAPARPVCA